MSENWVRAACRIYTDRTNGGVIAFGRVGKALKELVEREGWATVGPAWTHFLTVSELRWSTPENFARTFPQWIIAPRVETIPPKFREVQVGKRMCLEPWGPDAA